MRARYPDQQGDVERDGVKLHWELFGASERTILFLPTWAIAGFLMATARCDSRRRGDPR